MDGNHTLKRPAIGDVTLPEYVGWSKLRNMIPSGMARRAFPLPSCKHRPLWYMSQGI